MCDMFRTDKLWIPSDAQVLQERKYVYDTYGPTPRFEQLVVTAKDGSSVLTPDAFNTLFTIHRFGEAVTATSHGETVSYWDVCQPEARVPFATRPEDCIHNAILSIFGHSRMQWGSTEGIIATINDPTSWAQPVPEGFILDEYLVGSERDEEGRIISAAALSSTYFLRAQPSVPDPKKAAAATAWENAWAKAINVQFPVYAHVVAHVLHYLVQ